MKRLFGTLVILVFCCQNILALIVIDNNTPLFLIDNIPLSVVASDSVEMPAMAIIDIALDMTIPQDTLVTCWGDASSGITVTATGGTGPGTYKYYIPVISLIVQASPAFSGLFAGTYTVFVEDLNGSIDSVDVTITQPDSLKVTYITTPAQCYGESTGMIDIQVLQGSGLPPYQYSWSGPNLFSSSLPDILNLVAGIYVLRVTDENNCIQEAHIVVDEPADLNQIDGLITSNYNGYNIACKGDNSGWIKLEITGGYTPFTFAWNTGDTINSISNLYAGIYNVIITDGLGCVHNNDYPLLEPSTNLAGVIQATTDYNGFNVSCFNGTDGGIVEIPSGGVPPYYWVWNGVQGGDEYLINQRAGHHYVELYDDNNCFWDDSITLTEPPPLDVQKMSVTDTCGRAVGEAYATNVSGGVPFLGTAYQYQWNSGDTSSIAVGLTEGNYNLIVTDNNGCNYTAWYEIADLKAPLMDFYTFPEHRRYYDQLDKPFFFIDISNAYWQNVVDWQWDFGDNTFGEDSIASHSYAEAGEYTILLAIETQYNCWDTISKKILIDEYALYIPNAVTPFTGDLLNTEFKAYGYGIANYSMKIYNRWGGMIFESDDINRGWDGTISNGKNIAPIGVYLYYIVVENIYGEIFKHEGTLDLIR